MAVSNTQGQYQKNTSRQLLTLQWPRRTDSTLCMLMKLCALLWQSHFKPSPSLSRKASEPSDWPSTEFLNHTLNFFWTFGHFRHSHWAFDVALFHLSHRSTPIPSSTIPDWSKGRSWCRFGLYHWRCSVNVAVAAFFSSSFRFSFDWKKWPPLESLRMSDLNAESRCLDVWMSIANISRCLFESGFDQPKVQLWRCVWKSRNWTSANGWPKGQELEARPGPRRLS